MILKNKKFIVVCSSLKIPVDEDELVKVYEALASGDVKILRRGWFNPSFFVGVQEDDEFMRKFREDEKYKIRDGLISEYPKHKDLFPELRRQIESAAGKMKIGDGKVDRSPPVITKR